MYYIRSQQLDRLFCYLQHSQRPTFIKKNKQCPPNGRGEDTCPIAQILPSCTQVIQGCLEEEATAEPEVDNEMTAADDDILPSILVVSDSGCQSVAVQASCVVS